MSYFALIGRFGWRNQLVNVYNYRNFEHVSCAFLKIAFVSRTNQSKAKNQLRPVLVIPEPYPFMRVRVGRKILTLVKTCARYCSPVLVAELKISHLPIKKVETITRTTMLFPSLWRITRTRLPFRIPHFLPPGSVGMT